MLDIIQIVLLLGACFACFLYGQMSGVTGLAKLLVHHKFMNEEDFDRFHKIIQSDKE